MIATKRCTQAGAVYPPVFTPVLLLDDGMSDPHDICAVLPECLGTCSNAQAQAHTLPPFLFGVGRI